MAAGRGTRLGADRPKALVPLGRGPDAAPLVTHALRGVLSCPDLSDVVVVAPPDRMPELTAAVDLTGVELTSAGAGQVQVTVVAGGAERSDSVAAGLAALPPGVGIVLVHDAARALTPPAVFERVVEAVRHGHSAVVPALPVTDTIKMVDARDHVVSTPDRNALRAVQTPQGFLRETLERAHHEAGGSVTDDAGLVESLGDAVFVVPGDPRSRKITDAEDLAVVESWLSATPARGATPVLLVLGGLPGTGKTTLARAWARSRRAAHVRVDTIEVALQRAGADQVGPQGYAAAYALAADQLALGLDVVADSVNPLPVTRAAWREVASASGATVLEVELTCAATEHRERVEGRTADIVGHQVPDWSGVQAADYVPWTDADVALDTTDVDVSDLLAHVEQALAAVPEVGKPTAP
ncbi:2-C-methyl-D-erythritol 4-phosphate cytidylyltransferase [Ornithinimicrobium faecis]|uniref:2-C-methyl-D-erythritol 4-phosphate cytidylyltransferase n=1 Tax=Ornithinimicrobium faecis TaxID=2934158 RepID=A0ABY4YW20_9MICO|nr:2-C-methyl-D-erythritol 4-phosphate cytidylyltransferase [Ornithinimicrobium sp. HY1793]USQ80734.1 2-C-methyl-D-erythritol 4-phosphate cytidylyltransferase [Ornithinimicrobium sp. HY1793]